MTMMSTLHRLVVTVFIALVVILSPCQAEAADRSWVKVLYTNEASPEMTKNVEGCLDTVADLLGQYHIYLSQPITVIVTSNSESYITVLMSYGYSRQGAEQTEKNTAAVSLNNLPVIIVKGTASLKEKKQEIYRVLPHEIFHQVQRQWAKLRTVTWMVEGAPELFRMKASEQAGLVPTAVHLAVEQNRIKQAKVLPSAHQIGHKDYTVFSGLAAKGYPVYSMSTVMMAKLVEAAGFDKVVYFYQQLHYGVDPENAFLSVFRVPMRYFLDDMDRYFEELYKNKRGVQ